MNFPPVDLDPRDSHTVIMRAATSIARRVPLRALRAPVARGVLQFNSPPPRLAAASAICGLFPGLSTLAEAKTRSLHSFEGKAIDASTVKLSDFKGSPILMVNVASR